MRETSAGQGGNDTKLAETEGTSGNLEVVLVTAIEALTSLDAECLEGLSRELEISAGSIPAAELERARAAHLVLGCLLRQTCRNLALFQRIQERSFDKYPGPPRITV
jgi:hypothetical protein